MPALETGWQILKVKQNYYTTQQSILRYMPKKMESICSHKKLYMHIHSSIIHNSLQNGINPNVQQQSELKAKCGIFIQQKHYSKKKEGSADISYNVDEP